MREILFRGKSYTDNKWHYGYYMYQQATPFSTERHEITDGVGLGWNCDPETVGQYTGLSDENGAKIFEGDIVSGTALSRERTGVIVWIEQIAGFGVRYAERADPTAWQESSILKDIARHNYSEFCAKVVGNIHNVKKSAPAATGAEKA